MMDAVKDFIIEHKVVLMLLLFVGILYWAFLPRFRRHSGNRKEE